MSFANSYETNAPSMRRKPDAKTTDYQIEVGEIGTLFTNKGAGAAVNFTLPKAADAGAGWWCEFFVAADFDLTVTSNPADKMVSQNDAEADSVAFATAGLLLGGYFRVVSDGELWYVIASAPSTNVAAGVQTVTIVS